MRIMVPITGELISASGYEPVNISVTMRTPGRVIGVNLTKWAG